jgi:ankyrin repeat protein
MKKIIFLILVYIIIINSSNIFAKQNNYITYIDTTNITRLKAKIKKIYKSDSNGMTALHFAVETGDYKTVKFTIKKGAKLNTPNIFGTTPIFYSRNEKITSLLINNGAKINHSNKWGETVIFRAAESGNFKLLKYLIKRGAKINKKNKKKETPLHTAIKYSTSKSHLKIIKYLISKGARINSRSINGWAPIHYAVSLGKYEAVKILIKKRANINLVIKNKNQGVSGTPIHIAIEEFTGNFKIIKLLLKNRCKLNLKNINNLTPIKQARKLSKTSSKNWYGTLKFKKKKRRGLYKIIAMLK